MHEDASVCGEGLASPSQAQCQAEGSRQPMKGFKQRSDMVRFTFTKGHPGFCVVNRTDRARLEPGGSVWSSSSARCRLSPGSGRWDEAEVKKKKQKKNLEAQILGLGDWLGEGEGGGQGSFWLLSWLELSLK